MARLRTAGARLGGLEDRVRFAPKIADSFYHSPEWVALVAWIKRLRGNRCEECGSRQRVVADHVVERKDGGADLDPANVQLLCHRHHAVKTAAARRRRARGDTERGGGSKSGGVAAS